MRCPRCGSSIERDARYCSKCGEKLFANAETSAVNEALPPPSDPPLVATSRPPPKLPPAQDKVGGNWGRKLLIVALGLGSAAAYYVYTPNESGSIIGHAVQSVSYGFTAFVATYLISWLVMSVRRKPMHGFFHRNPVVFLLPMALIALSSGLQLARAMQNGSALVDPRAQQLQREIEALQVKLPNRLADGITMTSIINGGDAVTFGFSLDATMFEPSSFSQGLEPEFRKHACSDASMTKFLTYYEIPVVMRFAIGNHPSINVRVAPRDCAGS